MMFLLPLLLLILLPDEVEPRASMLPKSSNMRGQECLKTSLYDRGDDEFACRNLGKCYRYFCEEQSRRCNSCLPPPCIGGGGNRDTRSPPTPYRAPDVARPIVAISAGARQCAGAVARVRYGDDDAVGHVVVTSARCVASFEVECDGVGVPCFAREDSVIRRVYKGFRSYIAKITLGGHRIRVPLNSQTVLIARQFMECGDCHHETATIRLTEMDLRLLNLDPNNSTFFQISASQASQEREGADALVYGTVEGATGFRPVEARLTGIWKKKMCVNVSDSAPTIGSPVEVLGEEGGASLVTTGVVTHAVGGQHSVARFDAAFPSFVGAWLGSTWRADAPSSGNTSKLYPRFDCFPPFPAARLNESLCLCSRGWSDESASCRSATERRVSELCEWNRHPSDAKCVGSRGDNATARLIDLVAIPGSIKKLELTSTNISNIRELTEILRHLHHIEELSLADNQLKKLTGSSFKNAKKLVSLSLTGNKIHYMHGDTFRRSKRLRKLQLNGNRIAIVSNRLFGKLVKLQHLNLKSNLIEVVQVRAFRKCELLSKLWLSHNRLETLPDGLFRNNKHLHEIRLDSNRLSSLQPTIFAGLKQLSFVDLKSNRLVSLPRGLFGGLDHLKMAIVSFNRLQALPDDLYAGNRALRTTSFRGNPDLTSEFTSKVFHELQAVRQLREYLKKLGTKQPSSP